MTSIFNLGAMLVFLVPFGLKNHTSVVVFVLWN